MIQCLLNTADIHFPVGLCFHNLTNLSECLHWVFPLWISSGACLIHHNGLTLPPTPDRKRSWRHYQSSFDVYWHSLTIFVITIRILEHLFVFTRLPVLADIQLSSLTASKNCCCPYKQSRASAPWGSLSVVVIGINNVKYMCLALCLKHQGSPRECPSNQPASWKYLF